MGTLIERTVKIETIGLLAKDVASQNVYKYSLPLLLTIVLSYLMCPYRKLRAKVSLLLLTEAATESEASEWKSDPPLALAQVIGRTVDICTDLDKSYTTGPGRDTGERLYTESDFPSELPVAKKTNFSAQSVRHWARNRVTSAPTPSEGTSATVCASGHDRRKSGHNLSASTWSIASINNFPHLSPSFLFSRWNIIALLSLAKNSMAKAGTPGD